MARPRINLLFVFIPVLLGILMLMVTRFTRSAVSFFGVAENQETEINLEYASTVNKIYVNEGEFVTKGTLLMEVTRAALDFKLSDLSHDITELTARDRLHQEDIRASLDRLRAQRAEKSGDILSRIRLLESEKVMNENLFVDLKSLPNTDTSLSATVYNTKLESLREELKLSIEPIDIEIAQLQQEMKGASVPAQTELRKMKKEVDLYQKEQEQLRICAPSDGLVGMIHGKPGENVPSFNALISFYEKSPNTVVAYLHESLSLQIKVGDSLQVTSTLHPDEAYPGRVSGLGHRIVEIPERLRKIPEIKSYGREVLISIPGENNFLQKEKVMLERLHATPFSLMSLVPGSLSSNSNE